MKEDIKNYGVGTAFIILGLLLLASLTNIIESSTIYSFVVPTILIFSGVVIFAESTKYRRQVALGLIATGTVSLLIRLNIIQNDVVNILLGATLSLLGAVIITNTYTKKSSKHSSEE